MPSVAIGDSPVEFTDSNGNQVSIPLSALSFDASNVLTVSNPAYAAYAPQIASYLHYLAAGGAIRPGPAATSKPALLLKAADPGRAGNNLQVTIDNVTPDPANPTDQTKTTFDATIAEQEAYPGLGIDPNKPNFVKSVLGTENPDTATSPGAVHLLAAENPALPQAGAYPLANGDAGTKASAKIPKNGGGGDAFTVEARKVGAAGNGVKVTISDVDTTANTFTLNVTWSEAVPGVKLADLQANKLGSGYAVTIAPPPGGAYAVPAAGTYALAGGAEKQDARTAQTTVVAG